MTPEHQALLPVLEDLQRAVEDLATTGLTQASAATRERIEVAFREASRLKIGRLAVALRYVSEEVKRWLDTDPDFSSRRLLLFLERAWILAHALARAIRADDLATVTRLLATATPTPVPGALDLVVLGVQKRVVRTTVAFDFRMRIVGAGPAVAPSSPAATSATTGPASPAAAAVDRAVVWSFVANRTADVPAEAWLHLPQPQGFAPKLLLEPRVLRVTQCALVDLDLALGAGGGARLMLGPKATITTTAPYADWGRFARFDRPAIARRLRAAVPGPLDLEVELQEEVTLPLWAPGARVERGPGRPVIELHTPDLQLDVPVGTPDTEDLAANLAELGKLAERAPLYGLLHVESCRLVFTPLAVIEPPGPARKGKEPTPGGPRPLMLSAAKVDLKQLMKTLHF